VEAVIGSALAAALAAGRAQFNQRFRAAQQRHRDLDANAWFDWIMDTLDPVVERVAAHDPGAVAQVAEALYEQALPLVATHWLGRQAREPVLAGVYRDLLIALAPALARDPARLSGSLLNALHQLCHDDAQRARQWADRLARLGATCVEVDTVLDLGRVLAWRCGWPAWRKAALRGAPRLPAALAQAALDLPAPPGPSLWVALAASPTLRADEVGTPAAGEISWLGRSGGFRGLGGPFARMPAVGITAGGLAASDGADTWQLAGDGYGTQAVRMGSATEWPLEGAHAGVQVSGAGTVTAGALKRELPELETATGWAWHAGLLAVTLRTSYQVALVRCPKP
jgi:hypothetical protein